MRIIVLAMILAAAGVATMAWGQTEPASGPAVGGADAVWRDAKRSPDERARTCCRG